MANTSAMFAPHKGAFAIHVRKHSGPRFRCPKCEQTFFNADPRHFETCKGQTNKIAEVRILKLVKVEGKN